MAKYKTNEAEIGFFLVKYRGNEIQPVIIYDLADLIAAVVECENEGTRYAVWEAKCIVDNS